MNKQFDSDLMLAHLGLPFSITFEQFLASGGILETDPLEAIFRFVYLVPNVSVVLRNFICKNKDNLPIYKFVEVPIDAEVDHDRYVSDFFIIKNYDEVSSYCKANRKLKRIWTRTWIQN